MRRRGWWLLVTGTGRCGTGYIAHVLSSVGVRCTHEGIFNPHKNPEGTGIPPGLATEDDIHYRINQRQQHPWWNWNADSSWLAAPFLEWECLQELIVVQLVRNPQDTLNSMLRLGGIGNEPVGGLFYQFAARYLPEVIDIQQPEERVAYFYVKWNQLIEPHADLLWRVEDNVRGLLDLLEIDHAGKEIFENTNYNHRIGYGESHIDLSALSKPIRSNLREMTERYGYDWPSG